MAAHECDNPDCALCRDDIASGNVWPPLTDLELDLLESLDRMGGGKVIDIRKGWR